MKTKLNGDTLLVHSIETFDDCINKGGIGWWTFSRQRVEKQCQYCMVSQLRGSPATRDKAIFLVKIDSVETNIVNGRHIIKFNEYVELDPILIWPGFQVNFTYVELSDYFDISLIKWNRVSGT